MCFSAQGKLPVSMNYTDKKYKFLFPTSNCCFHL